VEKYQAHLEQSLRERNLTLDEVLGHVDDVFGDIQAIFITGSLVAGFGNKRSDLDICPIVRRDRIGHMPFASFAAETLVDMCYFASEELQRQTLDLRQSAWPPVGPIVPDRLRRQRQNLVELSRFAAGFLAKSTPEWSAWHLDLHDGWLARRIEEWHDTEALRYATCAHWLHANKPRVAVELMTRATISCCESAVVRAGILYQDPESKWLPDKLLSAGLKREYELLRSVLRRGAGDAFERARAAYEELRGSRQGSPELQLWLSPPIKHYQVAKKTYLSKFGMEAVEVDGMRLEPNQPVLRLVPGKQLRDGWEKLFEEDWLCLTIATAPSA
jgi:hypothetical protein